MKFRDFRKKMLTNIFSNREAQIVAFETAEAAKSDGFQPDKAFDYAKKFGSAKLIILLRSIKEYASLDRPS